MQAGDKFNLEVNGHNVGEAQVQDFNGEATVNPQEVHGHDAGEAQVQDFNGEATVNPQEVHKHHKRRGQTRDMVDFSKLLALRHESTTAAQNADEIPSTAEFQNEGFLHGTSQQLLPLIQPNVNNVTQKTSAPSNFTCVTNIPYKGSLFQKEQRTILPAFESSDQDEEDFSVPDEDPEGVDLGSSDSCSDQGDSSTSAPGGYSGDNEESDFSVPDEDPEGADLGSSDSCSDQGDSSTSAPGGYSGDNEESDFPVPQEDPEGVDMGSSDDGLL